MTETQIAALATKHKGLRETVRKIELEIRKGVADLRQVESVTERHHTEKPSVANVLPDDPLVTGWKLRQEQLTARRTELISYVDERRSQLAVAQGNECAARNQLNEAKLHEVRRQIKEVRTQFEDQKTAIEKFDLRLPEIERAIPRTNEEIGRLHGLKGPFPDYGDPDIQAIEQQEKRLLARRADLLTEKHSAPDRMQAIKLYQHLEGLLQQERTLVDELSDGHAEVNAARFTLGTALPVSSGLSGVR